MTESPNRVAVRSERIQDRSDQCPCRRTARGDGRAAERFILSNARLLDVDYGASRYVPWSAIDSHRLPSCVYVTPVSVRWW